MMNAECQQTRELLDSYLSAELLVETNHQILRHISGCDGCRAELARRQRVRTLMKLALPGDEPPADLVRRISEIPRGPGAGADVPMRSRVRSLWHRLGRGPATRASQRWSVVPTWMGQALAGTTVGALIVGLLVLLPWAPWAPARLTASELLARSDQAARAMANRPDVVLHRSLTFEERRGRGGPVVSRRRIEVWQDASSGIAFRRAFDERNSLVAGESLARNGVRTLYRVGAAPEKGGSALGRARPVTLERLEADAVWRLDLSATEYASLIPWGAVPRVEDVPGHFILKYEALQASGLIEATLKIRRDTLLPIEQTVMVERGGEVREYAFSETRLDTLPRKSIAHAIFEPDAVLLGRVDPLPARVAVPEPVSSAAPAAPRPSLEAELDVIYRLHRAEAWVRDSATVSRGSRGTVSVSVAVATEARRSQLRALLGSIAAPGVSVDIKVDPTHAAAAATPPAPPSDLHSMAMYDQLRDGFRNFIDERVPVSRRPSIEEQNRIVDGLVRSIASRSLERSHGALRRALALEGTLRRFSSPQKGELSADAEATLQTMLRDYARGIESRLEALRLELQPILRPPWSIDTAEPQTLAATIDLTRTAEQLSKLMTEIDAGVVLSFGSRPEGVSGPRFSDPALWRAIAEGERLAAAFKEPLPLGAR